MHLIVLNLESPSERILVQPVEGRPVRMGRKPESLPEEAVDLIRIAWNDRLVSRNHCEAVRKGDQLELNRLPALTGRSKPNALYTLAPQRERETLEEPASLEPGRGVIIGAKGQTAIFWVSSIEDVEALLLQYRDSLEETREPTENDPISNQNYVEVEQLDEYSLRLQLKLLQKDLPEQVLTNWNDSQDLFTRASVFLENALPGQKGVSSVFLSLEHTEDNLSYQLLNPDPLARADFRPSRTLLERIDLENLDHTQVYVWSLKEHQRVFRAESLGGQVDWVIILPVARLDESAEIHKDDAGNPIFLYLETRQASEAAAASFVPFLRLITSLVASLLSARAEQKLQDQMAAYFSPGLRKLMQRQDQSVLEPAMVDCTVMFADRRGHSRMLEVAKSDDEILDRLEENQNVVGLITNSVFSNNGVITDFAGDGALGLWGWPNIGDRTSEHALEAVEAAEAIIEELADHVVYEEEHQRYMAAVRIGISTGRIAVGKTGPEQQWHISVFGSVANLGARLERIAKEFRIPVLISHDTYLRIKGLGDRRFRRLCLIRPAGFEESYSIYELVLPQSVGGSGISDEHIQIYEAALDLFIDRKWSKTLELLEELPGDDPPTAWLRERTLAFRRKPPSQEWRGDIQSLSK